MTYLFNHCSFHLFLRSYSGHHATCCCGTWLRLALLIAVLIAFEGQSEAMAGPRFSHETVKTLAEALSRRPYKERFVKVEGNGAPLTYDEYRDIQFDKSKSIWRGERRLFQLQLFAPGGLYSRPVQLHLVEKGRVRKLSYSGEFFQFGDLIKKTRPDVVAKLKAPALKTAGRGDALRPVARGRDPQAKSQPLPTVKEMLRQLEADNGLTFSGFRVHGFINSRKYRDEFAVFQGASYFRATGQKQYYGLSARGLAIDTAQPTGEEFPYFRSFWIERPKRRSGVLVVHGLLDSPSLTGAYEFRLRPGRETVVDVQATLYPRRDIDHAGFAPLTSMFQFGDGHSRQFDDFRPAVHDSEGLLIHNGGGEWLWRPLRNPSHLQISSFLDENPKGFGLIQRTRDFDSYRDLEARYDRRPSLWIEPRDNWGRGAVMLFEIPTNSEINDNIVALWAPEKRLKKGQAFRLSYRMHWGKQQHSQPPKARVAKFMTSARHHGRVLFVIDFEGRKLKNSKLPRVMANTSRGVLSNFVVQHNSVTKGWRVTFLLDNKGAESTDIRLSLREGKNDVSEIFLYRWTNDR